MNPGSRSRDQQQAGRLELLEVRVESLSRELAAQRARLGTAMSRAWQLGQENRALEVEVAQRRLAEELARGQSEMLIQSISVLASESNLDRFLGHVLKATVDQLGGIGGTLWFPNQDGTARLHLEYLESRVIPAAASRHPAVRQPPPVGGGPGSTFPEEHPETYVLAHAVAGLPEANRRYIMSLGVRALLTVPMVLGSETAGWICIRSSRMDPREMESQIRVAGALAGQATLAMQMARLGEQARQAAVLDERNRIARDIHDTMAQGFTGVVLNLEASRRALAKLNIEVALEHIEHSCELARTGLDEARQSVRALRPDARGHADLAVALRLLIDRVSASGAVRGGLLVSGDPQPLARDTETELVRIAQESMTNILKHSHARAFTVELGFGNGAVRLRIADDGAGFDVADHHDGFGLLGMHERAERLGTRLEIESERGKGTRVQVTVPASCDRRR